MGLLPVLLAVAAEALGGTPLDYEVVYRPGDAGRLAVTIGVPDVPLPSTLVMPRAIPMGYGERPYDRFVTDVAAWDAAGAALPVARAEGPRWRIGGEGALRRVSYAVDLARMEREIPGAADASKARPRYVGLLGYSVLAYLEGMEERAYRLRIAAPEGWPILSTLAPSAPPATGALTVSAPGYYALADSQIAMGPDLRVQRVGDVTPLYVALYAEAETDAALVGRLGRQALDAMLDYFGTSPFPRYTIHMEVLKPVSPAHEYGFSMEHLDSGTFFLGVAHRVSTESSEAERERSLYNLAHHIAHSWIPKRCHGEGYFPFSWELAPVIDTIWLSEGFAQYAAIAALAERRPDGASWREKRLEARFRRTLAEAPDSIRRMSAVALSRVASTRYATDFRTGASSFARGGLMAAEMDDLIRSRTEGRKSFRDALRHLIAWSQESRRAFAVEELPDLLAAGTGVDVGAVLRRWLAPYPPGK